MTKAIKTVLSHLTIVVICSLKKKVTILDLVTCSDHKILGSNTLSKVPLSTFVKGHRKTVSENNTSWGP